MMDTPDQRLFEEDVASAEFQIGAAKGRWGMPALELLTEDFKWPRRLLWVAAAPRPGAAGRFYIAMDAAGYRAVPPTGSFWDPATRSLLDLKNWPKGKPGSRFAKVFRTDWNNRTAFYHPYDRVAAEGHKEQWKQGAKEDTRRRWTSEHTIVDYLEEFHGLLNCGDYVGI
jgi:hypothetical protein